MIIGGFLVHLSLGTIYTFGNISPYIVSYIRNRSHPADFSQATSTWVFACALVGQGGSMFVGGWMVKKIGPRWTTLIGGWLMSVGVGLSYFTIKVSFWLLLVTYGLLFGVGVGIAYIGPLNSAMNWMPKWKGLANGIVVAGFGFGAFVFNYVQTFFINPHNLEVVKDDHGDKYFTDPELVSRVPMVFIILAATYAVMQLVGSLLITNPPDGYADQDSDESPDLQQSGNYREVDDSHSINTKKLKPKEQQDCSKTKNLDSTSPPDSPKHGPQLNGFASYNEDLEDQEDSESMELLKEKRTVTKYSDESDNSRNSSRVGSPDWNDKLEKQSVTSSVSWSKNVMTSLKPSQVLKKPSFYHLWCMFATNGFGVILIATQYKAFGQDITQDDHFLAVVGSVAAVFNFAGRIVWGLIADKISYKFALVLLSGIMTMFGLTFYACSMGGKGMFFVWVCVLFFCIGGNFSLFPTAIGRAFGLQYVAVNYGLLFTSQIIAGMLGAFLSTILQARIQFYGIFFLVSGFAFVGFILAILYKPKRYISLQPK